MLTALVALATVGFTACGDDKKDTTSTPAAAPAATTPAAADSGSATVTIAADPGGNLAYDKKTLSAKAGEVTVEFTNDSQVPHNVAIEQGETEAGSTDTIMKSKTSKAFTLKAGTYTFYCTVGNHKDAGMQGTLTVQ
jgi:plastocyanin